jgi:hypothetical protein
MLPGFYDLVDDMDISLNDAKTGLGEIVLFTIGSRSPVSVNAFRINTESPGRIHGSTELNRGIRVTANIQIEISNSDVPTSTSECLVRFSSNGPDYEIADVTASDRKMSVLTLIPHKTGVPKNGSWIRDEN